MSLSTILYSNHELPGLLKHQTFGNLAFTLCMKNGVQYEGTQLNVAENGIYLNGLAILHSGKQIQEEQNRVLSLAEISHISVQRRPPSNLSLLHRIPATILGQIMGYVSVPTMMSVQVDCYLANAFRKDASTQVIPFHSIDRPMTYRDYSTLRELQAESRFFSQIQHLDLKGIRIGTNQLEEIVRQCKNLKSLNLTNTRFTDFSCLRDLPLEHLTLASADIADMSFATLPPFPRLQTLVLTNSKITDASMVQISQMPSLKHINLQLCRSFSDIGISHLQNLPFLQYLDLFGCHQLTNETLSHLGKMTELRYLCVGNENVRDSGLEHLTKLQFLVCLDLSLSSHITDNGISKLQTLVLLKHINLSSCDKITDAGIRTVWELPILERLTIQSSEKVTPDCLKQIALRGLLCKTYWLLPCGENANPKGRLLTGLRVKNET